MVAGPHPRAFQTALVMITLLRLRSPSNRKNQTTHADKEQTWEIGKLEKKERKIWTPTVELNRPAPRGTRDVDLFFPQCDAKRGEIFWIEVFGQTKRRLQRPPPPDSEVMISSAQVESEERTDHTKGWRRPTLIKSVDWITPGNIQRNGCQCHAVHNTANYEPAVSIYSILLPRAEGAFFRGVAVLRGIRASERRAREIQFSCVVSACRFAEDDSWCDFRIIRAPTVPTDRPEPRLPEMWQYGLRKETRTTGGHWITAPVDDFTGGVG